MLSLFNFVVFIHIVCAILWIGSAVVLEILEWKATHANKREQLAATLNRSSWFGGRVFAPAAVLTILSGVVAVAVGRPTFGMLWVILALVGVVVVSALGGGVVGRRSAQLSQQLKDSNVSEQEIEQGLANIRWAVYLDLALLLYILFDMVMKPTTLDPGFFGVSAGYFVVVLGSIAIHHRRLKRARA